MGDSDAPRYFRERQFVISLLAHQVQFSAKQRRAKIAMVVRLVHRHVIIVLFVRPAHQAFTGSGLPRSLRRSHGLLAAAMSSMQTWSNGGDRNIAEISRQFSKDGRLSMIQYRPRSRESMGLASPMARRSVARPHSGRWIPARYSPKPAPSKSSNPSQSTSPASRPRPSQQTGRVFALLPWKAHHSTPIRPTFEQRFSPIHF